MRFSVHLFYCSFSCYDRHYSMKVERTVKPKAIYFSIIHFLASSDMFSPFHSFNVVHVRINGNHRQNSNRFSLKNAWKLQIASHASFHILFLRFAFRNNREKKADGHAERAKERRTPHDDTINFLFFFLASHFSYSSVLLWFSSKKKKLTFHSFRLAMLSRSRSMEKRLIHYIVVDIDSTMSSNEKKNIAEWESAIENAMKKRTLVCLRKSMRKILFLWCSKEAKTTTEWRKKHANCESIFHFDEWLVWSVANASRRRSRNKSHSRICNKITESKKNLHRKQCERI